jgi:hypothetical protein
MADDFDVEAMLEAPYRNKEVSSVLKIEMTICILCKDYLR